LNWRLRWLDRRTLCQWNSRRFLEKKSSQEFIWIDPLSLYLIRIFCFRELKLECCFVLICLSVLYLFFAKKVSMNLDLDPLFRWILAIVWICASKFLVISLEPFYWILLWGLCCFCFSFYWLLVSFCFFPWFSHGCLVGVWE